MKKSFSKKTIKKLQNYVYAYIDKSTEEILYVGISHEISSTVETSSIGEAESPDVASVDKAEGSEESSPPDKTMKTIAKTAATPIST